MNSSFKLDFQLLILYWTFLKLTPPPFQRGRRFSIKYLVRSFIPLQNPRFDTVAISIFFCDRLRQLKPSVGISLYREPTSTWAILSWEKILTGKVVEFFINKWLYLLFFPYISPLHLFTGRQPPDTFASERPLCQNKTKKFSACHHKNLNLL